jgi:hypothetical protein
VKKHKPKSDFPHYDPITLKYDDIKESSCFKHLDARWEKEKAFRNPKNMRKAV